MKRLVVLGGGESGVGAAVLGIKKNYDVFVSDIGEIKEEYKNVLNRFEIKWEEKQHTKTSILNADLVVKSPGIPDTVPLVSMLLKEGIPVVSEIEFASKYTNANLIAITGSNGKTTTTMLTHHLLSNADLNVGMAGNIGDSFAKMVCEDDKEVYVLEISSFQLDGMVDFKPHIAIITNITPDHLDRYDYKLENYIASKCSITKNQTSDDFLIYDADDEHIVEWLRNNKVAAKLVPFSISKKLSYGAYLEKEEIVLNIKEHFRMGVDTLALEGKHNVKNAMAAATVSQLLSIRKQTIRESLENFHGAEHRLEKVLKIQHVQYINDSKATNVNATFFALDSVTMPTVWIVGGTDKGNDYVPLMPMVREKVKAIICLGVDNEKLIDTFHNAVDVLVETTSMEEAVKMAYRLADRNDTVLLSPACASFDLFENYEDRGRQFKDAVKRL